MLASSPEFRQMMAKYAQIREELEPPFLIEYVGKSAAAEAEESEAEGPRRRRAAKPKKAARAVPEPVTKPDRARTL